MIGKALEMNSTIKYCKLYWFLKENYELLYHLHWKNSLRISHMII